MAGLALVKNTSVDRHITSFIWHNSFTIAKILVLYRSSLTQGFLKSNTHLTSPIEATPGLKCVSMLYDGRR